MAKVTDSQKQAKKTSRGVRGNLPIHAHFSGHGLTLNQRCNGTTLTGMLNVRKQATANWK